MQTLFQSIRLWLITLVVFGVLYPLLVLAAAQVVPVSLSETLKKQVGQEFKSSKFFWGRPSAVAYNAAATGGSNQGPTNPAHLQLVAERRDTILKYHPYLQASQIPSEWLTASGSGLDPHITRTVAVLQAERVASANGLPKEQVLSLIDLHTNKSFIGTTEYINLLELNQSILQYKR